jgi:hypothetical protein
MHSSKRLEVVHRRYLVLVLLVNDSEYSRSIKKHHELQSIARFRGQEIRDFPIPGCTVLLVQKCKIPPLGRRENVTQSVPLLLSAYAFLNALSKTWLLNNLLTVYTFAWRARSRRQLDATSSSQKRSTGRRSGGLCIPFEESSDSLGSTATIVKFGRSRRHPSPLVH